MGNIGGLGWVLAALALMSCGNVKTRAAGSDGGAPECVPATPPVEICDNDVDDDCNGEVDDFELCDVAAFMTLVRDPSGGAWAPDDAVVHVESVKDDGGVLECRSGKVDEAGEISSEFVECPDGEFVAAADEVNTADGLYRTEIRYIRDGEVESPTKRLSYYIHNSLVNVPRCEEDADAEAYFQKARERLDVRAYESDEILSFDPAAPVDAPAFAQIANPFIRVNFTPRTNRAFGFGVDTNFARSDGLLQVLSLRRHFEFNDDKSLLLVRRRYQARRGYRRRSCSMMTVKSRHENGGDKRLVTCSAIVLNREGAGVCLRNTDGVVDFARQGDAAPGMLSRLADTMLGEVPLADNVDNALWRKLGGVYSPTSSDVVLRSDCKRRNDKGEFCAPLGYGSKWKWRYFSPKCYGEPTCVGDFRNFVVSGVNTGTALYLPDDLLFRFE